MSDDDRRLGLVRIDRTLFAAMFKTGAPDRWVRCVEGLPDDAELVGLSDMPHFTTDEVTLKFRSKSFPICHPGDAIMYFHPTYSAIHVTAADLKFLADNPEDKRAAEYRSGSGLAKNPYMDVPPEVAGMDEAAPHVVEGT